MAVPAHMSAVVRRPISYGRGWSAGKLRAIDEAISSGRTSPAASPPPGSWRLDCRGCDAPAGRTWRCAFGEDSYDYGLLSHMTSIRAPSPVQVGAIKSSVSPGVIDSGAERRTVIQNNIRPSGTKTRRGVIGATYPSTILPRNVAFGGRWKWGRTSGSHFPHLLQMRPGSWPDRLRRRPSGRPRAGVSLHADERSSAQNTSGRRCENAPRHGRKAVKAERIGSRRGGNAASRAVESWAGRGC